MEGRITSRICIESPTVCDSNGNISRELRACLPLELLYADDLILMADSEESLRDKIVKWKSGLEAKD